MIKIVEVKLDFLPENIGERFGNIILGPRLVYWPRTSSMKNNGKPAHSNIVTYGIKKAAENTF